MQLKKWRCSIMLSWETEWATVFVAANLRCYGGTQQPLHPTPTPMSRCLIWDLAAELGRETAVALRSHKQDVRDKLSQHTHRARGARWVRAMSMNAINNANRRCTYFISSGYLVSELPARCVTSERQQRRSTLWYRVDQVNIQMNCEQRWSVLINTESLGVPSITPAFISAASVDMLTGEA